MKNFKQVRWPLPVLLFTLITTSCKKEIDKQIIGDHSFYRNACQVTHSQDDLLGDVIDLFYNAKGNPDSLTYGGTPITLKYDHDNRLLKINYGTYAYFDFKYEHDKPLPIALYYYYPNFGGLIAIDSFYYNFHGQIIQRVIKGGQNSQYGGTIESYTYDYSGNVIKVDTRDYGVGAVNISGYTEFTSSKYDNKPNFLSINPWTKYLFFHSDYDGRSFLWTQFSRNNAANFVWTYDAQGDNYSVTSTFQYDNKGFATSVSMDWNDTGNDLGIFTRQNTSTCDVASTAPLMPATKLSLIRNRLNKAGKQLPIVTNQY